MNKKIVVSGTVSDFHGNYLSGADIHFNDEFYKPLFTTKTDKSGQFSIEIENRKYKSVFICKDYSVNFLEFWYWDYQSSATNKINAKIDGLELYGMKAWSTMPTYLGLIVYFRPMSLAKYKKLVNYDKNRAAPVCPELFIKNIEAKVNGEIVQILGLNSVQEFMDNNQSMGAYLLHLSTERIKENIRTVCINITEPQTNEFGMGCIDL